MAESIHVGILICSDTRTQKTDESTNAIEKVLQAYDETPFLVTQKQIVGDEIPEIQRVVKEMCHTCDLILTCGGTGFGKRDVTPEVRCE